MPCKINAVLLKGIANLVLDLAQQSLFAHLVNPEGFPNTRDNPPLEGHHSERNVVDFRLHNRSHSCLGKGRVNGTYDMQQFKAGAIIREFIRT